jgi:4-amino-4-deoxy-L-arabinose transferase-like glycosyltransferase
MPAVFRHHWLFILLLCLISIFYFAGINQVPFHPDESTYLFMSAEFEAALSNPLDLAWDTSQQITPIMRYRMIDAPLPRYLVGISRSLFSQPAGKTDWDWGSTWEENEKAGALPAASALLTGRLAIASLFPLSLVLIYLIGIRLQGRIAGIAAVLVFSLNPLVLLHTRRVMAEGLLVFAMLLVLVTLFYADRYPFLAGLAVGLAFNAKHSAVLLFPVGLLAAGWINNALAGYSRRVILNLLRYTAGFLLLVTLLNPFLWGDPISALRTALAQRQELIAKQLADYEQIAPAQVLDRPVKRAAVAVAQVYIAPPTFAEAGNYMEKTASSVSAYLDNQGNNLGRQVWAAGMLIALTLFGLFTMIRTSITGDSWTRSNAVLFLLSFLSILGGITLLIHLAWQRYYLPLIPFMALFSGLGLAWGIKTSRDLFNHGRMSARLSEILAQFAPDSRVS